MSSGMSSGRQAVPQERERVSVRTSLMRVVVSLVVLFGAYVGLQIAVAAVAHRFPASDRQTIFASGFISLALIMLALYALLVRLLERRWPKELSFRPGYALGGVALGAGFFCALYAVLWQLGVAHWQGWSANPALVRPFALALAAGFGEEIAVRGGVFRTLEDGFGTTVALIVSAALFGLLHALNHGATPASTAAIAIEAGAMLGLAYAAVRNLWLPIGLHFGWNFTEGGVFGAAVSGGSFHGAARVSLTGPDLMTGGAFGPEASIVAVGLSLVLSIIFAVAILRHRDWKPFRRAQTGNPATG